jgi:hypothetical protein
MNDPICAKNRDSELARRQNPRKSIAIKELPHVKGSIIADCSGLSLSKTSGAQDAGSKNRKHMEPETADRNLPRGIETKGIPVRMKKET